MVPNVVYICTKNTIIKSLAQKLEKKQHQLFHVATSTFEHQLFDLFLKKSNNFSKVKIFKILHCNSHRTWSRIKVAWPCVTGKLMAGFGLNINVGMLLCDLLLNCNPCKYFWVNIFCSFSKHQHTRGLFIFICKRLDRRSIW